MEKAATTNELKKCFADHLKATLGHIKRLEQAFELLGTETRRKMRGDGRFS
jgi:ferritin-like metal-binding protein YciE